MPGLKSPAWTQFTHEFLGNPGILLMIQALAAVTRELEIAVVRADPNQALLLGRFADGINGGRAFR